MVFKFIWLKITLLSGATVKMQKNTFLKFCQKAEKSFQSFSKNAKILEVGCSTGKLLHFIKTKGFKNVKGIEPAPKCRAIAKKLYDVEVVTSTFANFKTTDRFDMIIFSEVLEHLIDVRDVILKVRSLLNENGMVYIGVPDAERFYKKFSEPFGEFSTEHINFFTYKSLSQLLSTYQNILVKSDSRTLLTLWKKEEETLNRMNTYIQKSQKNMDSVMQTIRSLPKQTIVWGVGALTQRLLKSTRLAKKVFLFVDSNKNIVGKKIDGILVISPNDLYKHSNPLLISSFGFKDEIFQEIKKRKLKNKIITFK